MMYFNYSDYKTKVYIVQMLVIYALNEIMHNSIPFYKAVITKRNKPANFDS